MPRIHPTAIIEDNVTIGEGSSVWDNVHIRHGATIGEECIVGEKSYIAYDVKIGKFPFSASGKARILGETDGFIKIVSEKKYDEVLGVHIIGPHATELLAEACVAMALEATAESIANTIHAHPTVSESMMEAAEGVHDLTIHM